MTRPNRIPRVHPPSPGWATVGLLLVLLIIVLA